MNFKKQLPEWNNPGTKPPQTKINEGWLPSDRPPADWWNWKDNLTFEALKELQENAVHKDETVVKEPTINAGAQTINAAIKTPVNVKRIDGKTIVNLIPLFDSGTWVLHAKSVIISSAILNHNATTNNELDYVDIFAKPSTNYVLSADISTNSQIVVEGWNNTALVETYTGTSFRTSASVVKLRIIVRTNVGLSVIGNLSLNEGTQAQPFVANVKGLTNPTIANETNGTSLVVPTTLYDGEYVEQNANGELVKYKKFKNVELTGAENFILHYRGATHVNVRIDNFTPGVKPGTRTVVKYNGTILQKNTTMGQDTTADQVYDPTNDNTGTLFIGISNADSGWGPNYYPTPEELKAFLLGWKMYDASNGSTTVPYNGTGTKGWYPINGIVGTDQAVLTLPTTEFRRDGKWQPYRLIYELATPVQEVIQPYSDLTLEKGENSVKVYAGRIVNELPKILQNAVKDGYHFNTDSGMDGSNPLRYKANAFVNTFKNNVVDSYKWELNNTFLPYGKVRAYISNAHFDTTASYTVDYEPLYTWEVTAPIDNVQLQYFETLVAVTNELVHDVAKQQDTFKRMLENVVNEESGLVWIRPTFLNGVTGGPTCRYAKSTHGTVYLFIYINISKAMTDTENLFVLPKGFRPKDTIYTPSIEYIGIDTATRKSGIMSVHASGHIRVGVPTGYATGTIIATVTFKAED